MHRRANSTEQPYPSCFFSLKLTWNAFLLPPPDPPPRRSLLHVSLRRARCMHADGTRTMGGFWRTGRCEIELRIASLLQKHLGHRPRLFILGIMYLGERRGALCVWLGAHGQALLVRRALRLSGVGLTGLPVPIYVP